MNLLLHVGTEKTGSSYLQQLCGKNRQFLQDNGLWFPLAGVYERQLQQGTVSPGNSLDLGEFIRDKSWASVTAWIKNRVIQAQQRNCPSLLLSFELLFAEMASDGAVDRFRVAASEAGIRDISCLLMIRDPIDQALSLYKHRAKSGRVDAVEEWIKKGYSLPGQLDGFLRQVDRSSIQIHVRKYKKSTAALIGVFFHDWLGVNDPPIPILSYVNPSLTLSELAVIRHIVASRPDDQRAFYSKFLAVPLDEKADGRDIETMTAAKIGNYLCRFNDIWQQLDARLAADGGIEVPRQQQVSAEEMYQFAFSEAQIQALIEAHVQSATIRYVTQTLIHRLGIGGSIRKVLLRLRNQLGSSLG